MCLLNVDEKQRTKQIYYFEHIFSHKKCEFADKKSKKLLYNEN